MRLDSTLKYMYIIHYLYYTSMYHYKYYDNRYVLSLTISSANIPLIPFSYNDIIQLSPLNW